MLSLKTEGFGEGSTVGGVGPPDRSQLTTNPLDGVSTNNFKLVKSTRRDRFAGPRVLRGRNDSSSASARASETSGLPCLGASCRSRALPDI